MSIALNIRKLRVMKEYSQEYMAYRLGVSQPTYCRIEKNGQKINFQTLIKIASILETSVEQMFQAA